ncbi:hypothetical protein AVEN_258768-1 [Araneus ventricosus]|uniref:Uncharacterized protein n=1 Tax=Araneus ventricosus TaxID=182803 RepID=A0A4Y2D2I5_ARAVE|nr:hypothetical protein AVEN_258768-1 [Araneus ventricosus]
MAMLLQNTVVGRISDSQIRARGKLKESHRFMLLPFETAINPGNSNISWSIISVQIHESRAHDKGKVCHLLLINTTLECLGNTPEIEVLLSSNVWV